MICTNPILRMLLHDECAYNLQLESNQLLFNPFEENTVLLDAWLQYRYIHVVNTFDKEYLAELAIEDMKRYGNQPSFMNFKNFDPYEVSVNFLMMWLSWYGITSLEEQPKEWWASTANTLLRQREKKRSLSFDRLIQSTKDKDKMLTWFTCVSEALRQVPRRFYLPKVRKRMVQQSLGSKQILAKMLGAAAIATPILMNYNQYGSLDDLKRNFGSAETVHQLKTVGLPFILTYAANKVDPELLTPQLRKAILKDINTPIPRNVIEQLIDSDSIWAQLFNYVLLPIISRNIKK